MNRHANYHRDYRRRVAARRRASGQYTKPVTGMIADAHDIDPWRKLAIAVAYMAAIDHAPAPTIRRLCTLLDIERVDPFVRWAGHPCALQHVSDSVSCVQGDATRQNYHRNGC